MSYDGGCGDPDCEICKADAEAQRMKMNTDPEWLKKMAEKEDNCDVSVGDTESYISNEQLLQWMDPACSEYILAVKEIERRLLRYNKLKSAVDTIPAAVMLLGGPPYKLTFTESCLREIVESQK